ncbi:hypothetical protein DFJ73DRAFT_763152 [Zopfochytrium polystomum]|nr:hypothetical protein DFJ73DRAFT_763152 [Zopfochytrium polystomum]
MDSVLLATGSSGAGGNSAAGASAGVGGVGGGGSGGGGGGGLGRRGRGGGGGGGGAGGAVGGGVGSGISGPQGISLIGPSVGGGIGSTGGGPGQFVLVDRSPNNSSIATTSTHSTNTSISSTATGATLVDSDRDREWARLRAQQTAKASRSTLRSGAGGSTEQLRSGSAPGIYNSGGSTFTNTPSHQTNVPNPPKYLTNSISFTSEGSMAVPTKPPVIPGALVAVAAASGSGVLMPRSSSIKRADEHDTSISQYHQQLFRHQQLQMYKQALYQQPSIAAANQRQQLQQPIHQHKQHQHQHVNSSIVSHQAPNNPSPPATDSDLAPTWLSNGGTSVPASQPLVDGRAPGRIQGGTAIDLHKARVQLPHHFHPHYRQVFQQEPQRLPPFQSLLSWNRK